MGRHARRCDELLPLSPWRGAAAAALGWAWLALPPLPAVGAGQAAQPPTLHSTEEIGRHLAALQARCGEGEACLRAGLADSLPASLLQPLPPPDSDRIRWASSLPSLGQVIQLDAATRLIALDRFGRRVLRELPAALPRQGALVLDLRANQGGDLARMLKVAGWFTGGIKGAMRRAAAGQVELLDVPAPPGQPFRGRLTVLVGPATASSAEALAALLRQHAGAALLGAPSAGKTYLQTIWPLGQAWQVLVPTAAISLPEVGWTGGLRPDGPLPPDWAALMRPRESP